mmetsp:Transcript_63213/g.186846  ORF Transcript_63213/g.186846 Transcript_63213/m.186846 type:complete len:96 (-) Transcript_63213:228-515(-)
MLDQERHIRIPASSQCNISNHFTFRDKHSYLGQQVESTTNVILLTMGMSFVLVSMVMANLFVTMVRIVGVAMVSSALFVSVEVSMCVVFMCVAFL